MIHNSIYLVSFTWMSTCSEPLSEFRILRHLATVFTSGDGLEIPESGTSEAAIKEMCSLLGGGEPQVKKLLQHHVATGDEIADSVTANGILRTCRNMICGKTRKTRVRLVNILKTETRSKHDLDGQVLLIHDIGIILQHKVNDLYYIQITQSADIEFASNRGSWLQIGSTPATTCCVIPTPPWSGIDSRFVVAVFTQMSVDIIIPKGGRCIYASLQLSNEEIYFTNATYDPQHRVLYSYCQNTHAVFCWKLLFSSQPDPDMQCLCQPVIVSVAQHHEDDNSIQEVKVENEISYQLTFEDTAELVESKNISKEVSDSTENVVLKTAVGYDFSVLFMLCAGCIHVLVFNLISNCGEFIERVIDLSTLSRNSKSKISITDFSISTNHHSLVCCTEHSVVLCYLPYGDFVWKTHIIKPSLLFDSSKGTAYSSVSINDLLGLIIVVWRSRQATVTTFHIDCFTFDQKKQIGTHIVHKYAGMKQSCSEPFNINIISDLTGGRDWISVILHSKGDVKCSNIVLFDVQLSFSGRDVSPYYLTETTEKLIAHRIDLMTPMVGIYGMEKYELIATAFVNLTSFSEKSITAMSITNDVLYIGIGGEAHLYNTYSGLQRGLFVIPNKGNCTASYQETIIALRHISSHRETYNNLFTVMLLNSSIIVIQETGLQNIKKTYQAVQHLTVSKQGMSTAAALFDIILDCLIAVVSTIGGRVKIRFWKSDNCVAGLRHAVWNPTQPSLISNQGTQKGSFKITNITGLSTHCAAATLDSTGCCRVYQLCPHSNTEVIQILEFSVAELSAFTPPLIATFDTKRDMLSYASTCTAALVSYSLHDALFRVDKQDPPVSLKWKGEEDHAVLPVAVYGGRCLVAVGGQNCGILKIPSGEVVFAYAAKQRWSVAKVKEEENNFHSLPFDFKRKITAVLGRSRSDLSMLDRTSRSRAASVSSLTSFVKTPDTTSSTPMAKLLLSLSNPEEVSKTVISDSYINHTLCNNTLLETRVIPVGSLIQPEYRPKTCGSTKLLSFGSEDWSSCPQQRPNSSFPKRDRIGSAGLLKKIPDRAASAQSAILSSNVEGLQADTSTHRCPFDEISVTTGIRSPLSVPHTLIRPRVKKKQNRKPTSCCFLCLDFLPVILDNGGSGSLYCDTCGVAFCGQCCSQDTQRGRYRCPNAAAHCVTLRPAIKDLNQVTVITERQGISCSLCLDVLEEDLLWCKCCRMRFCEKCTNTSQYEAQYINNRLLTQFDSNPNAVIHQKYATRVYSEPFVPLLLRKATHPLRSASRRGRKFPPTRRIKVSGMHLNVISQPGSRYTSRIWQEMY